MTGSAVAGVTRPNDIPGQGVAGVNAARGVVLLGMIALHSLYPVGAEGRPTWSAAVLNGRVAAAFAVLGGIGIAFLTGRRRVRRAGGGRAVLLLGGQALGIGTLGLLLGYTDPSLATVILPYYAMMAALALPLVFLPTWVIAVLGLVFATGMPALSHVLRPRLIDPVVGNPTVGFLIEHPVALLVELSLTGMYPALPWMAYLCAGLVVGRLDLSRTRIAFTLLAVGTAFAVGASAVSWLLLNRYGGLDRLTAADGPTNTILTFGGTGSTPTSTWWWLAVCAPHTGTPFDLLHTTGTAVTLLAVLLLAGHVTRSVPRRLVAAVREPLAAAGALLFVLYPVHIVYLNSTLDAYNPTTGYLVQVAMVLIIGMTVRLAVRRDREDDLEATMSDGVRGRARWWRHGSRPAPSRPVEVVVSPIDP
ncbi:MAG TPA: heparan-alpha-glucosaminide N-acetyltransferase domain-containing protein [Micromonosporaceae bacterium]